MIDQLQLRRIADYYDRSQPFYKMFWHRDDESHALHYGFWDQGTKNLKEALLNENRFLASAAGVADGQRILDAGCGVGGSSLWLAKNFDVQVTGITLSENQLQKAVQLAEENGVQDRVDFHLRNYLRTDFPEGYFDLVWAIESVCYAEDKRDFLREAYRILRPGGKLVVADGFLFGEIQQAQKGTYQEFLDGLVLPNLAQSGQFGDWMREAGFKDVRSWDKTEEIRPSAKILYRRTSVFYPPARILQRLGFMSSTVTMNGVSGIAQYKLLKAGAGGYVVFCGEK